MLNFTKYIINAKPRRIRKKFIIHYVRKQKHMINFCVSCKGSGTNANTNKKCKQCYGTGLNSSHN